MRIVAPIFAMTLLAGCDNAVESFEPTPTLSTEADPTTETPTTETPTTETPTTETPTSETPTTDGPPYLISRYSPSVGLSGTRIRILTGFEPNGCAATGECTVTIDDQPTTIVVDEYLLEVIVPRFVATGPLCVTWRDRTECGDDFVVLDKPLVHAIWPTTVKAGTTEDVVVTLSGEGFTERAELLVVYDRLKVDASGWGSITAVIPAAHFSEAGTLGLNLYVPDANRCGATSDTVEITVTP